MNYTESWASTFPEPVAPRLWLDSGEWNPAADPHCNNCLMGVPHIVHDRKAFNATVAFNGEEREGAAQEH